MKELLTSRYRILFEEIAKGGPAGYGSVYLTSEGEPGSKELYNLLDSMEGKLLPAENRNIRQRNGSKLVQALSEGKSVGIASGFKPSGAFHFGHKLTSGAVSFFQKNGIQVFIPIADVECEMDTRMSREEYLYWAADNLLDWGANGVNLDAAHVYLQSEERRVNDLAYIVARGLTFDLAVDTYAFEKLCGNPDIKGDKGEFPFLFAGVTQVGDIILPQHPDFKNYHSFMVSGQDQDGHMKITMELVKRAIKEGRIISGLETIPSGFYIPHIRGLTGSKQSSSEQEGTLYLGSGPEKLGLEERITKGIDIIDHALSKSKNREEVHRGALDMVRYIDSFNIHSSLNFMELHSYIPRLLLDALEGETDDRVRNNLIDGFLIRKSQRMGQDNVELIRDCLPEALEEHQKKRQKVLDYAKRRSEYVQEAWNVGDDKPIQPEFWEVPKKAVVDETKRNSTQWFHIVNAVSNDIIA